MSLPVATGEALLARERGEPHRRTGFAWLDTFLAYGCPAREVPSDHWSALEDQEGHAAAYLECVCGVSHSITVGAYPQSCTCPRWFFYDGTRVWALLPPAEGNERASA